METSLTVFPDTSVFLQCKALQELPWYELGTYAQFCLILTPTVLDELDEHAHGPSERRTRRSRTVLTLVDQILKSPEHVHVINDVSPRVTLSLGDHPAENELMPYPLKETKADDRILFEYRCFARANPTVPSLLVTGDRGASAVAMKLGLPYIQLPDSWLLPPEPSDQDKRIKALEAKVLALQSTQPVVEIQRLDPDGVPYNDSDGQSLNLTTVEQQPQIEATIKIYPKLNTNQVSEIVELAKAMHPLKMDSSSKPPQEPSTHLQLLSATLTGRQWMPPSEEDIASYRDTKYPMWVKEVENWAGNLADRLNSISNVFVLRLAITNTGGAPAKRTVVSFEVVPDGLVFDASTKSDKAKGPPPHPIAPIGHYEDWRSRFLSFSNLGVLGAATMNYPHFKIPDLNISKHDPHAFYYHPNRPLVASTGYSYICDAFRHKLDAEIFTLIIRMIPGSQRPGKGAVRVQVTADNLPMPTKIIIPFTLQYETLDTLRAAKDMLEHPDMGNVANDGEDDQ